MFAAETVPEGAAPDRMAVATRPLTVGLPFGRAALIGSIGPFVRDRDGAPCLLVPDFMLDDATVGRSPFYQPPPRDLPTRTAEYVIGQTSSLPSAASHYVGLVQLQPGVAYRANCAPANGLHGAPRRLVWNPRAELRLGDNVAFHGGASGYSEGEVTALDIRDLRFAASGSAGAMVRDGLFEVCSHGRSFSRAGDGGALVFRTTDNLAVGLVYAAAIGREGDARLSYILPISAAISALGLAWLEGDGVVPEAEPALEEALNPDEIVLL